MSRKLEITFLVKVANPHTRTGNYLIYLPKAETEIYGIKPGDWFEITMKKVEKKEESK